MKIYRLNGWKTVSLCDIAEISMGQSPPSEYYNNENLGLPFLQGVTNFGDRFPKVTIYCTKEQKVANPGDILFSVRAPVGRINLAPEKLIIGRGLAAIKSKHNQQHFLFYALKNHFYKEDLIGTGAIFAAIKKDDLSNIEIQIPEDLKIQKKISSILKPYDDLIEINQYRIKLLEEAARLLYQEWFVRLRFPGHENTKIVDGVPEGWESLSLIEALELQRGFDLPLKNIEPGDVPVYGSTGIIGYHNVSKVKGPGIITGRSGSLGIVQYVLNDYWPHNTALWVKTFKKVTPLFALYLLRNLKLEQYNGGVSVPTLDRKVVHRIQIIIPPPRIMNEFESSCSDSYALMMNLSQQNTNLIKARDLLIPRLMNGVIPV